MQYEQPSKRPEKSLRAFLEKSQKQAEKCDFSHRR
jgi:hypothetical protein